MTDSLRPNVDESSNDGKKNALAPVDESAVQTNVDADDETRATKEDDVPFYNANWFDEDEKETFGQKLKRLLSLSKPNTIDLSSKNSSKGFFTSISVSK